MTIYNSVFANAALNVFLNDRSINENENNGRNVGNIKYETLFGQDF